MTFKNDQDALVASTPAACAQIEALFRQHQQALRRFVRRILGPRGGADDVVQETFVRLINRASAGHLRAEAKAYMFQVALNVARDLMRRRRTEAALFEPVSDTSAAVDPGAPASRSVEGKQAVRQLWASLDQLGGLTRTAFVLYHVERLTVPEIARRTGKTTRTIERHLARALAHCAPAMSEHLGA